jgi:hypothetical protein
VGVPALEKRQGKVLLAEADESSERIAVGVGEVAGAGGGTATRALNASHVLAHDRESASGSGRQYGMGKRGLTRVSSTRTPGWKSVRRCVEWCRK